MNRHGRDPGLALLLLDAQAGAGIGAWTFDDRTKTAVWTEEVHPLFGTDPDTFVPDETSILDPMHPDDREAVRPAPPSPGTPSGPGSGSCTRTTTCALATALPTRRTDRSSPRCSRTRPGMAAH